MGDMAGLPALSDPRLIILQKQSKRMRKGIAIKNDKLRAHRDRVGRMEEKYKTSDEFRSWQVRRIFIKNYYQTKELKNVSCTHLFPFSLLLFNFRFVSNCCLDTMESFKLFVAQYHNLLKLSFIMRTI